MYKVNPERRPEMTTKTNEIAKYVIAVCKDEEVVEELVFDTEEERNEAEADYEYCNSDTNTGWDYDKDGEEISVIYFTDYVIESEE